MDKFWPPLTVAFVFFVVPGLVKALVVGININIWTRRHAPGPDWFIPISVRARYPGRLPRVVTSRAVRSRLFTVMIDQGVKAAGATQKLLANPALEWHSGTITLLLVPADRGCADGSSFA